MRAPAGATVGGTGGIGMTDDVFAHHRSALFTVAYEMLGSAADAEDVVQETGLRWDGVDHAVVRDPRAYASAHRYPSRAESNAVDGTAAQGLLRQMAAGAGATGPGAGDHVELADSVSMAMLTVLETLGLTEPAAVPSTRVFDFRTRTSPRRWASHRLASARPGGFVTAFRPPIGGNGARNRPSAGCSSQGGPRGHGHVAQRAAAIRFDISDQVDTATSLAVCPASTAPPVLETSTTHG